WRDRLLLVEVLDRFVRQMLVERVVVLASLRHFHFDGRCAVIEGWLPLVRLAADETIEVVEALHVRPTIERSGGTSLPIRDVVVLAEESRAISVLAYNF